MAVTYDDLEEKKLGRQTKIAQLADAKIEDANAQESQMLDQEKAQLDQQEEEQMTQDAMRVIEQMDIAHAQGQDPMQIYSQMPEILQAKISELLQQRTAQQGEQQDGTDGAINPAAITPQQSGAGIQPLARTQQGNANITDTARQIANFQ